MDEERLGVSILASDKNIFDVFFREKPAMMLVELKNANANVYASVLAKQIDCTYSHVVKILQEMHRADLINWLCFFTGVDPKGS